MPRAVVEQQLTARRGRERTRLHVRVFAPTPWEGNFRCRLELTADGRVVFPPTRAFSGIGGADSLQAFVLALRCAAYELMRFELDTGMRIDAWEWSSLIALIADTPIDTYMRERISEIQSALRGPQDTAIREGLASATGRTASAAKRKPRAARRSR